MISNKDARVLRYVPATSFCLNHVVNAALFLKYNLNVSCATNQIASAEEIENRGLEDFFLLVGKVN